MQKDHQKNQELSKKDLPLPLGGILACSMNLPLYLLSAPWQHSSFPSPVLKILLQSTTLDLLPTEWLACKMTFICHL